MKNLKNLKGIIRFLNKKCKNPFYNIPNNINIYNKPNNYNKIFNKQEEIEKDEEIHLKYKKIDYNPFI